MKTIRFCFIMVGCAALLNGLSFADSPKQGSDHEPEPQGSHQSSGQTQPAKGHDASVPGSAPPPAKGEAGPESKIPAKVGSKLHRPAPASKPSIKSEGAHASNKNQKLPLTSNHERSPGKLNSRSQIKAAPEKIAKDYSHDSRPAGAVSESSLAKKIQNRPGKPESVRLADPVALSPSIPVHSRNGETVVLGGKSNAARSLGMLNGNGIKNKY